MLKNFNGISYLLVIKYKFQAVERGKGIQKIQVNQEKPVSLAKLTKKRQVYWNKNIWVLYTQGFSPVEQTQILSLWCVETGTLGTGASIIVDTLASAVDTSNEVLCL